jgi:TatD DNase family protein
MIIDTHAHYNLSPLLENWQQHWQKAQAKGIVSTIIVGANLETSQTALEVAKKEKGFFASVGVHPDDIAELDINFLENLIKNEVHSNKKITKKEKRNKKIIAIGEIGLDYFRLDPQDSNTPQIKQKQKEGFIKQIELANKLNLPIIVHIRDAYNDALEIIKNNPPKNKFVLHCFSGNPDYIKEMIELGAYFGVDGNITYKNASDLRDLLHLIPKNKVIVETDSPYLPPIPYRGKVCEPWMITLTADYLSENFQISKKQLLINSQIIFPALSPCRPEF